jgi:hypothetical protein
MVDHSLDAPGDNRFGFCGRGLLIGVYPGNLLAYGYQFTKIRVEAGPGGSSSEGCLVQVWRAGCNNDPRQTQLFDIVFDELLAQAGAHEFVIARKDYTPVLELIRGPPGHIFDIHNTCNIRTTMTNIDSNFFIHNIFSLM